VLEKSKVEKLTRSRNSLENNNNKKTAFRCAKFAYKYVAVCVCVSVSVNAKQQ